MKTAAAMIFCALLLSACASRPGPAVLETVAGPCPGNRVELHVASSRAPDFSRSLSFSEQRSHELRYARYGVCIPPGHKNAEIEWPNTLPPDPAKSFAVQESASLTVDEFLNTLSRPDKGALAGSAGQSQVYVYVHGYNTNYPESLYRAAQIEADNPGPAKGLLFAWPSDGFVAGYVADKDAATVARDELAQLLTLLAEDKRFGRIVLAGHSMGCWLTMESLRQLALSGRRDVLGRLGTVILAAPDIDLDVFMAQIRVVGPLDPPITVLTSPDDRALSLSNTLGGQRQRLGSLDVQDERIQYLATTQKLQIIDISDMAATDSLNHDRFLFAAASLQKLLDGQPQATESPIRRAGAFVLKAAASVLEVPGKLGRAVADSAAGQ